MSYLVLARKCRPTCFSEVVGQQHITQTLANAIKMDRVAHGFLFSGVRGVGKTSLARILAKSLNCKEGPTDEPCGVCESCKTIAAGTSVDVMEIDGASNNSVDDIRELRESVPYRPIVGRYKIYVVDEVHMLSVSAFNALLKTLEEPPPHVKFIFATTESHKIPMTILSRVQRYDFRRIPTVAIVGRISEILKDEGIEAEDAALAVVGQEAAGSMRDALSILDQVLAAGNKSITADYVTNLLGVVGRNTYFDLCGAMISGDAYRSLEIIHDVDKQGFDMAIFTKGLLEHLRNLIVVSVCTDDTGFLDIPIEEQEALVKQARRTNSGTIHRIFKHVSEAYEEISRSAFPKILLEATVARLADLGELVPAGELVARLEMLSKLDVPVMTSPVADEKKKTSVTDNSATSAVKTPETAMPSAPSQATAEAASAVASVAAGEYHGSSPTSQPSDVRMPSSMDGGAGDGGTGGPAVSDPTRQKAARPADGSFGSRGLNPSQRVDMAEWKQFLEVMLRDKPSKASMVERAKLAEDSTRSRMVLIFDSGDAFTTDIVADRELSQEVAAYLSGYYGFTVNVEMKTANLGNASVLAQEKLEAQEQRRIATDKARGNDVVTGFTGVLKGRIASIKLND